MDAVNSSSDSDWGNDHAWGLVASGVIYTTVVLYSDNHKGTAGSWGIALGVGNLQGMLLHMPWSKLTSAKNDFYVESSGNVGMQFLIDGEMVAVFTGGNLGIMLGVGINGWMEWS